MAQIISSSQDKGTGSCACRRIKFETSALPTEVYSCYCRECGKMSGSGFLPLGEIPSKDIKYETEPETWKFTPEVERGFCAKCGSTIMIRYGPEMSQTCIVLSAFDHTSTALPKISKCIFLKEKADWVVVPDDGSEKCQAD